MPIYSITAAYIMEFEDLCHIRPITVLNTARTPKTSVRPLRGLGMCSVYLASSAGQLPE